MIKIISLLITPFAQNFRLVFDDQSKSLLMIDPGGEVGKILKLLGDNFPEVNFTEPKVLLTHAHIDHGGGVKALINNFSDKYGVTPKLLFHRDNDLYRETIEGQANMYGMPRGEYENVPKADAYLEDEEEIELGDYKIRSLFTPGHAPGHLSLYIPEGEFELKTEETMFGQSDIYSHQGPLLIAGDALFKGSIGRTDLPGGNHQELLTSIKTKLLILPDETLVLAGHGPDTTIGVERRSNPFLIQG